jgi:hypothetical protein
MITWPGPVSVGFSVCVMVNLSMASKQTAFMSYESFVGFPVKR